MRIVALILTVLGLYLLAYAAHDEFRGVTHMPLELKRRNYSRNYLYRMSVAKEQNPELFRKFMLTHWIYAGVISIAGCALIVREGRNLKSP